MKPPCNILRQPLNLPLFPPLRILVIKPRQHMFLVQLLQLLRFRGNASEELSHFVADVGPAGREKVHFYYGIAVVFECGRGHETAGFFKAAEAAAEAVGVAIAAGAAIAGFLGWVMGVGLAVGDISVVLVSQLELPFPSMRTAIHTGLCDLAMP
jgi:hypothetical protein